MKSESNFWSGFYLGMFLTAGGLYLFGTKKGRETVGKILDATENLEESAFDIMREFNQEIKKEGIDIIQEATDKMPIGDGIYAVTDRIKQIFHSKDWNEGSSHKKANKLKKLNKA